MAASKYAISGFMFADRLEDMSNFSKLYWNAAGVIPPRTRDELLKFGLDVVRCLERQTLEPSVKVVVKSAYIVVHDKDARKAWDMRVSDYTQVPKPWHVHFFAEFEGGRECGLTTAQIAGLLGYAENMVEKPRRGKNALDNMKAYLMHAKDADKYLYDPSEVITIVGQDYVDLYCEQKESWDKGRAAKTKKRALADVDELIERARKGEVGKEQLLLDDDLYEVYSLPTNKKKVDAALEVYAERRMAQNVAAMKQGLFSTVTLFVYGPAGSGKSMLCESLIDILGVELGWRSVRLAAKNAMDEYMGQEIAFLDDVRGGAMDAETWLGFLDPNHESTSAARYNNKSHVAPRLIIITSNKPPLEMFYFARGVGGGDRSEAVDTFFRRIGAFLTVENAFDVGPYNIVFQVPQYVEPYAEHMVLPTDRYDSYYREWVDRHEFLKLRWAFVNVFDNKDCLTPYGAVLRILRMLVDKHKGEGVLIDLNDTQLTGRAFETIHSRMLPAMESGAIPELPMPKSVSDLRGQRLLPSADKPTETVAEVEDAKVEDAKVEKSDEPEWHLDIAEFS